MCGFYVFYFSTFKAIIFPHFFSQYFNSNMFNPFVEQYLTQKFGFVIYWISLRNNGLYLGYGDTDGRWLTVLGRPAQQKQYEAPLIMQNTCA